MRKFSIFISYLFVFSFSIYAQGNDEEIDFVSLLTKSLDSLTLPKNTKSIGERLFLGIKISNLLSMQPELIDEETKNKLVIARLCERGKENFNVDLWNNYKEEILEKCQARYPSVEAKRDDNDAIVSIEDPQDQSATILFDDCPMMNSAYIPLKDELKKQLLDKMNDVSNYGFSTVDVKATHSFLEEEKLLLYIVKSEGRNLLDDLSTDDTHIYTKDDQLQTKIDFEYSGLNLSGALHSLTWSYLGRTGRSIYNYFTSSDSN